MWKDINDRHVWTWPIIWSMPPQSPVLLPANESTCGRTLLAACGISIFLFFFTMEHWFLLVLNFHCIGSRVSWWPEISRSSVDGVSEKTTDFLRNRDTRRWHMLFVLPLSLPEMWSWCLEVQKPCSIQAWGCRAGEYRGLGLWGLPCADSTQAASTSCYWELYSFKALFGDRYQLHAA